MPGERVRRQVQKLLDDAEAAASSREWAVVRDCAQAVLRVDPSNEDAQYFLKLAGDAPAVALAPSVPVPAPSTSKSPLPDLPSSFASGRYAVKKFLGEGGKKKVYLAHDTTLDRDVAFALIKSDGLDDAARTRVLREAQAMGRLGAHPNIVTVFDLGTQGGQPYMVIELLDGGDVAALIERAKERRPSIGQTLNITRDACRGLAFAHGRGIVHRDLKPGNIWLTADGAAKIGDFGLALPLDQSRLTREGFMVGTVAYMPPEQAMGGEITPRADLYSLGCMLYEMVTGRPPFLGDDDIAIIGQHINTPPVAPSWHNPACPKPLDALIMRLLAKDPAQRPESAQDVLNALEGVEAVTGKRSPVQIERTLESVSSGVFVGRHKEMDQLRAALEEALSGRGRMVALVGEPGIGKTRTSEELATYGRLRKCQVLWGRCYDGGGAPPYWPWVQVIRQYARERRADQLRREMGSAAPVIAEVVTEVKERIAGLQPPPPLDNPESARFRLFDSIATFLKAASKSQPLIIVLDDLHWSDKPSLMLLEFVARDLGGSRILLMGTYRDVEVNRRHPLAVTLGDLTRERLFERLLLRGIGKEDIAKFIEIAAGVKPPDGLVEAVHTQTEGNPLFVTEVVRWLVQEGQLAPEKVKDKKSWSMPIPEGIRDVVGKRLNRLSSRCNDVLTTASVVGRQFGLPLLVSIYSAPGMAPEERLSEQRLLDLLDEALGARIIEELAGTPGHYQFTHALIQETLSRELTVTRSVRLHAEIAETLERLYGEQAHEHASELVVHLSAAETLLGAEKLVGYSIIAGDRAVAKHAYEEAQAHFQRVLDVKGPLDPARRAAAMFGLGRAQIATNVGGAWHTLRGAFDQYEAIGDRASAVAVAACIPPGRQMVLLAAAILPRALELADPESADEGRLWASEVMVQGLVNCDRAAAMQALEKAVAIARQHGDLSLEAAALSNAAHVDSVHLRHEDSIEKANRVFEIAPQAQDALAESQARVIATIAFCALGDLNEARRHNERDLAIAERTRFAVRRAMAAILSQVIVLSEGDFSKTRLVFDPQGPTAENPLMVVGTGLSAYAEFQTGEFERGNELIARVAEAYKTEMDTGLAQTSLLVLTQAVRTYISGKSVHHPAIWAAFERAKRLHKANPGSQILVDAGQLLKLVVEKDSAAAATLHAALNGAPGWRGFISWYGLSADRLLGLLAFAAGNSDSAQHFEDAIRLCRRYGRRAELAWCSHEYADVLAERDRAGDKDHANRLREEALAISGELGMQPLVERLMSRRKFLKA